MRTLLSSSILALSLIACTAQNTNTIAVGEPNGASSSVANGGIIMEQTSYSWKFQNVGTDDEPRTKIVLFIQDGDHTHNVDLGTYAGSAVDASYKFPEAIIAASAWWAGGGDDLRVVADTDGSLIAQHRTVDEVSGFGDWMDMQAIED